MAGDTRCSLRGLWEHQVKQLGQQFFKAGQSKRKKLQLPECAKHLIAFKRQVLDFGRSNSLMTDAAFKAELRQLEKLIRPMIWEAQRKFYDSLLQQACSEDGHLDQKELYAALLRVGRRKNASAPKTKPLPTLQRPDGSLVTSFEEKQQLWFRQFEEGEAGFEVPWEALCSMNGEGPTVPLLDPEPTLFPSEWQLLRCLRKVKRGRAAGPNDLPPDLLQAAGPVLVEQLQLITNKAVVCAREPLQWKSGKVFPLFKGKGPSQIPSSYRSIFVSDFTAKLFHQAIRNHIAGHWERCIETLQCGGRKAFSTDIAQHVMQSHRAWAASHKLAFATVFFDIKAAFYSVLRQAVVKQPLDVARLSFALEKHGQLPAELDGRCKELESSITS